VNIANEPQKNGISFDQANQFIKYCINDLKLNVIGLMCIPPIDGNPNQHFKNQHIENRKTSIHFLLWIKP
jgi:uncharacterized pyridoxal phosphate-containing UPF0001 family protein